MPDLTTYYDQNYRILIDSEDEDQLYVRPDGSKTFRTTHQVETLLAKANLPQGSSVLDFGCAKSSTLKRLLDLRPDIQPYVFDVSDMYVPFWEKFIPAGQWACHHTPEQWRDRFDLVTSFFALEHVEKPVEFVESVHLLLKPGGTFYCIVPNVYANTADFVVADHVNHFSASSLRALLTNSGFEVLDLDDQAHSSAWVVCARKVDSPPAFVAGREGIAALEKEVLEMAEYWRGFADRVRAFEARQPAGRAAAIYGSGFYGTFIATCLAHLEFVGCFLDQNPHRQKQKLLNRPILAPADLPEEVGTVYVGLNPRIAKEVVGGLADWASRAHHYFFP